MICSHCGAENVDGATFCKVCGHELIGREAAAAQPSNDRRPLMRAVRVALALAAIIAVAILMMRGMGNTPDGIDTAEVQVSSKLYYTKPEASHVVTDEQSGVTFVDNELVVYLDPNASEHDAEYLFTRYGGTIVGNSAYTSAYLVRFTNSYAYADILDLSQRLQGETLVEAVSRNVAMELVQDAKTKDPAWSDDEQATWGLRAIRAQKAWGLVKADASVRVGVLDGPVFANHEDLVGTLDAVAPTNSDADQSALHGTQVAGAIAAQSNDKGSVGVAYGATLCAYDALANTIATGNARSVALSYDLDLGLSYLVAEQRCRVINMSLGIAELEATPQVEEASTSAENAIRALVRAGYKSFVICKSAGNQGEQGGLASNDVLGHIQAEDVRSRVILVASASRDEEGQITLSDMSNRGARVDVVAPGERIFTTSCLTDNPSLGDAVAQSTYDYCSGTSMATSMTSGVAALAVAANPELLGEQIKQVVCDSTSKATYEVAKKRKVGLLNAQAAVKRAQSMAADKGGAYDPGVSLGGLNQSVTSDGTYVYAVVEDNEESYAAPSPALVRISQGDKAGGEAAKVIWKGAPVLMGGIPLTPIVEPAKNGLFVLVPGLDWSTTHGLRLFFVPSDNKATKELDLGDNVEWSPYGKPFLVCDDRVVYATVSRVGGTYWEVHSCDFNGSSVTVLGSGFVTGSVPATSPVALLGARDNRIYIAAIHQEGENRWIEVFSLALDGSGDVRSVLRTASLRGNCANVCLVGNALFTTERNELVRHDLKVLDQSTEAFGLSAQDLTTESRTSIATVEGTGSIALWNMTDSVAYVYSQDVYPPKTWKIDLASDDATPTVEETSITYPTFGYASLELVGDDAYTVYSSISKVDATKPDGIAIWP